MRILMVNKFLYPRGGAETYVLKIGEFLMGQGHEIQYFGMFDEKNTVGNSLGEYTSNMDFHSTGIGKLAYPFRIIYSFDAKEKIGRVLDSFRPDIVHMNNINFQLTPSVIDACVSRNVPVVQTVHDYQMLCPNHLMFDAVTGIPCERCLHGSKWNCTSGKCIHGSFAKSLIGSAEALLYRSRKTYEKVDLYICPSKFMESKLNESNIYSGKTVALHNFIDIPDYSAAAKGDYILYFGRLSEEKGIDILLRACADLPDIKLIIAGSGPMEAECRALQNVEFVGFKTGKELTDLISGALFSVYPSIWYENCPLSVLESESLGTPVLSTKMGGIPELIEDGQTGVLLKELTQTELREQISRLYNDRALTERMAAACLEKRGSMITLPDYCSELLSFYGRVLN